MDTEQRLEVLCQIVRDYKLMEHIEENRNEFAKALDLGGWQIGHDIALLDTIAHGAGLYPANYHMAIRRAGERLGLTDDKS